MLKAGKPSLVGPNPIKFNRCSGVLQNSFKTWLPFSSPTPPSLSSASALRLHQGSDARRGASTPSKRVFCAHPPPMPAVCAAYRLLFAVCCLLLAVLLLLVCCSYCCLLFLSSPYNSPVIPLPLSNTALAIPRPLSNTTLTPQRPAPLL